MQDEDAQPITQPIVAPVSTKTFAHTEEAPATLYEHSFLGSLASTPESIRNVAVVGHLHHGKTSLLDLLIEQTHESAWDQRKQRRYTDARKDEQERELSIKATPVSLLLQDTSGKSALINAVDTPGHLNFVDQMVAGLRLADCAVVVVDALEGVMAGTEAAIQAAVQEGLPLVLVLNKLDRLVLELKLPPSDAYFKLAHVISEVNAIAAGAAPAPDAAPTPLDPADGNVLFASSSHKWLFSLHSFAAMYLQRKAGSGKPIAPATLAQKLWGDCFLDCATGRIVRSASEGRAASGQPGCAPRSFVHFVLEPIYKVYAQVLGEDAKALPRLLAELGVRVSRSDLRSDPGPLLNRIFAQWLGSAAGLVTALAQFAPSPVESAPFRIPRVWSGRVESQLGQALMTCDASGPLVINVVQQVASQDGTQLHALGRVWSGTAQQDMQVRVLGESFGEEDQEESHAGTITRLAIGQARYMLQMPAVPAGNWVLISGLTGTITKSATLIAGEASAGVPATFRPLQHVTAPVVKLSVEPIVPTDLPKMLDGLRQCSATYPLMAHRTEESGEHVIMYTGELGLDCIMHDLREVYGGVEVKVADPVTCFAETVLDTSKLQCFGESANGHNKLTMIAEPLDRGLPEALEAGQVPPLSPPGPLRSFLRDAFSWDILAASSVWATGPSAQGPNMLLNDTLDADEALLATSKDWIVQGFQWSTQEGPLADEPMRGVKVRLLDASLAGEPIHRGGGQLIPTARRVVYSSFLLASPRIMEPVFAVEAQCPADAIQPIFSILQRRRGHVVSDAPIPGTPFYKVHGYIPAMDSFGFETDVRVHTQGLGFVTQRFDHWAIAPGDPLDRSIVLRPLEPSPTQALARDFMIKTRRRKGLSEDVSISKFFDDAMLLEVARAEAEEAGEGSVEDAESTLDRRSAPEEGSVVYSD